MMKSSDFGVGAASIQTPQDLHPCRRSIYIDRLLWKGVSKMSEQTKLEPGTCEGVGEGSGGTRTPCRRGGQPL